MKHFSGFPTGKLQVTPLPNLFFSELVPAIDDLAELKVTLHVFWRLANAARSGPAGPRLYVTAQELRADATLMPSLAVIENPPGPALARGLARATERGTLLYLAVPSSEGNVSEGLYFLNTETGRRALEQVQRGDLRVPRTPGAAGEFAEDTPAARPNIYALYEQNIGLLTPLISEELKEAEQTYPAEWIVDAFKIAVENNKRRWNYVSKILARWKDEGREGDSKKNKTWYGDEYGKFVKR